ncbi:MAG: class I SAM-dependent methyltransferase, partial [Bacteroidia bacterium]|nr:class I SAM-dependent methyltransferase [Bacteroidia bacterium]
MNSEYVSFNREAWNQKTGVHAQSDFYDVESFKAGKSSLNVLERDWLGNVKGQTLLHLQCHFGMDSISWARLGAKVTGVDLSDKAIALANQLAAAENADAQFVCCNVYDTRLHISGTFDIVFTSYGTIGWLPDLNKWAEVIARSLKPGGRFLIVDFHPALWMFDDEFTRVAYPYNSHQDEPIVETLIGTYANRDAPISTTTYGWNHGLAKIFGALMTQGLVVKRFEEYTYSNYPCFQNIEQGEDGFWRVKVKPSPKTATLKTTNFRRAYEKIEIHREPDRIDT